MKVPEEYRVRIGKMGTTSKDGNNGLFLINRGKVRLNIIASDGMDWDHVSVTVQNRQRCPTWEEMCFIKDLFFSKYEWVTQFHPASAEYVNNHRYCLHLWRYQGEFPTPLKVMV